MHHLQCGRSDTEDEWTDEKRRMLGDLLSYNDAHQFSGRKKNLKPAGLLKAAQSNYLRSGIQ